MNKTQNNTNDTPVRIPVGISQCLLGDEVRYDGGHKHDHYITGTLSQYFEFIPVCPELAIGMGVPREPIRLTESGGDIRAVGIRNPQQDVTESLQHYGSRQARELKHLCGYIFKRGSPSCGMERVKVYTSSGRPNKNGSGIYAHTLMQAMPWLPCEEEGRLGDPALRENFIERVFTLQRWRDSLTPRPTAAKLVEFHSRHKYILMAHSPRAYQQLGQLVAHAGKGDIRQHAQEYLLQLMSALKKIATRKSHTNVLQHLQGYLKQHLDTNDKQEMLDIIRNYQRGLVPLIVPITLLQHHFRRHPDPYIAKQYYLTPHPQELMLRNQL